MKLVFLPGMDGTGLLFNELIQNIPQKIDREIVCLNEIQGLSYLQQAEYIAKKYESSNIIVIAESYSGRLAYELCKLLGDKVLMIIFIASFVSCPCKLAKMMAVLPEYFFKPHLFPKWLLKILCFGGRGDRELLNQVRHAIARVEPRVLKQRLLNIAKLDIPTLHQTTKAVYIRPTNDRLVTSEAVKVLSEIYPQLDIESVDGGHFIAQTSPELCARVILRNMDIYNANTL